MFENIIKFFKKFVKEKETDSKDTAKERLHLVLMQDRANVSADFLELMKQEIIDVIKKYIDVDENSIDVKLTNKQNGDGTTGAPILYANIPIVSIKDENKNKVINENKAKNEENNKIVENSPNNKEENGKVEDTAKEQGVVENIDENAKEQENTPKETIVVDEEKLEENASNEKEQVEDKQEESKEKEEIENN